MTTSNTFHVGQKLEAKQYDEVPVGTRVSAGGSAFAEAWFWEKLSDGSWCDAFSHTLSRPLSPEDLASYGMRIAYLPEPEPEPEPDQEQVDALYDEAYAKGIVDAYTELRLASSIAHTSYLDAVIDVVKAAKLARRVYWEALGEPRRSEPKRESLAAWVSAISAAFSLLAD